MKWLCPLEKARKERWQDKEFRHNYNFKERKETWIMKRIVALFSAVVLCMGLAVPAMAAGWYGPYSVKDSAGKDWSFTSAKVEERTITLDWFGETMEEKASVIVVEPGSSITYSEGYGTYMEYIKNGDRYAPVEATVGEISETVTTNELFRDNIGMISFSTGTNFTEVYVVLGDGSSQPQPDNGFSDVAANAWYAEPVKWAVEKGITSGTSANTFSPDMTCTTAQILTFLWRANGSPAPTINNPFTNVANDAYYASAAVWAYEKGLVSGSSFEGDTPCTRSATVTYLWKLAEKPAVAAADFTDVAADAEYAQAVAWAVQQGITAGTSATTFSPDVTCTRGQIVTFLYRDMA